MHQFLVSPRPASPGPFLSTAPAPETKSAEPPTVPPGTACRIVRQLVVEMTALAGDRPLWRRDTRRSTCHVRQISMYVCHVVLRLSMADIGACFGRDRSTVGHACNVVEDRRDDAAFDAFVAAIERVVLSVFGPAGIGSHE